MQTRSALHARLDAVAVDGLCAAADGLLGDAPDAVCSTLGRWRALYETELPWLAGPYWSAVAPLGLTVPEVAGARVLSGLLIGAVGDPVAVGDALALRRAAADATWTPLPDDDVVGELWRRALVTACEEYWHALAAVYVRLHPLVAAGDRAGVADVLAARSKTLEVLAERIGSLVQRITDPADRPRPYVQPPPRPTGSPPTPMPSERPDTAPTPDAVAPVNPSPPPHVPSTARDHPVATIGFLLLALAVAGMWLYTIATHGLPF